jgi:hypothetical protein
MELTDSEKALLAKKEAKKLKHNEAQAKYRANVNKDKVKEYNKKYYEANKKKIAEIEEKIVPKRVMKPTGDDKIPSFKTRTTELADSTIIDYLKKAEVLQSIFHKNELSKEVKLNLLAIFIDNEYDEKVILNEMKFLTTNVMNMIQKIRNLYPNDNSFKSYINVLAIITSHFKSLPEKTYQTLTKVAIKTNDEVQIKRQDNILEDKDKDKIISLDKTEIMDNMAKLRNIEDKMVYGLYTLFPARRLDWRNVKITNETDVTKLDSKDNYLIVNPNVPLTVVFNNYKTSKTYGKQSFEIEDEDLKEIFKTYILAKQLQDGDYLFFLKKSRELPLKESYFSLKVSELFKTIYGVPVSVRFLRMSWSTYINTQQISFNEKQKYIQKMAHSVIESQRYFKLPPLVSVLSE